MISLLAGQTAAISSEHVQLQCTVLQLNVIKTGISYLVTTDLRCSFLLINKQIFFSILNGGSWLDGLYRVTKCTLSLIIGNVWNSSS